MKQAQMTDRTAIEMFVLAGKATFTLVSKKTGTRYTYRVNGSEDGRVSFVSLLTGSDNENSYSYFGLLRHGINGTMFAHGAAKAKVSADAESAKAFAWFWQKIASRQELPAAVEFWHEGRCGRCFRKLTVPSSIASGFGPECAGKIGCEAV